MIDLPALLQSTSRTFAVTIPLLPEPTRQQVTVAYLLLRIGDTLEDASDWSDQKKISELTALCHLIEGAPQQNASQFAERMAADPPGASAACLELLHQTAGVLAEFHGLGAPAREIIAKYVAMTLRGMTATIESGHEQGRLQLRSVEELQRYCYIVAGLVGELLTELFLLHTSSLHSAATALRQTARAFGEGLQLTNILKDETEDVASGRCYLPIGTSRSVIFELARADLTLATRYVQALRATGAPRGVVEFTSLPVRFAQETLAMVETFGSGAKISRSKVEEILASVRASLDQGTSIFPQPGYKGSTA